MFLPCKQFVSSDIMVIFDKPPAKDKTEPSKSKPGPVIQIKHEPSSNKSPEQPQREAIWIVETDSDNEDVDQPGPSGLQQQGNKEDAALDKKSDEEDKAQ